MMKEERGITCGSQHYILASCKPLFINAKPNYQDSTFAGVAVLRSVWCVIGGVAVGVVLVVGNDGPIHTRRMADGAETVTQQIPHLVRGVLGDDDSGQVEIFVPSLP